MAELRTEEEQLEALKKWWNESGKSWVTAVLVVAAGWTGWDFYEKKTAQEAALASEVYQQFVEKTLQQDDEVAKGEAYNLATTIKKDFTGTAYSSYAALFLAKQAVDAKDLATAEKELQFAVDNAASDDLKIIATLRLARVEHAQGKSEAALKRVDQKDLGEYQASYSEVKGDILFDLDRKDEARDAYQLAITQLKASGRDNAALQMKLDDLAVAN